ncbi:hypothetical protein A9K55_001589 [Cordyceps militaris]|uniref:25S rRNA (Uridine(2843)-N(3))-methyltransferase n=1 Tax=Cordyceps militaris TaxID=73501 RepID=A0A2H4SS37_CORMI|nr:hypothetical protein A9K55_001589 [Cordyceps militaris]
MVQKQANPRKKKPAASAAAPPPKARRRPSTSKSDDAALSLPRQQRLLNHFMTAFADVLAAAELPPLLQTIKQALYRRDFAAAFGCEAHLAAYAARWSPPRALCYAGLFQAHLPACTATRMVCVGGGAAELVAFASFLGDDDDDDGAHSSRRGELTLVDAAPWEGVADTVLRALTTPLPLSPYASASAHAANAPLLAQSPEQLRLRVVRQDVLHVTEGQWADMFAPGSAPVVVTLLFTLNELYTEGGIAQTTRFLRALEAALPDGSLLLVVDSPGSYSEAALGKDEKKYPMQWLLHHTLTKPASASTEWTRLESHDSIWFRLSDQLKYPIQLENMRYQLHLYRIDKTPT